MTISPCLTEPEWSTTRQIGTIEAGKFSDFAVLEVDPTEVPVERLKEIKIWGVVFEGRKVPSNVN